MHTMKMFVVTTVIVLAATGPAYPATLITPPLVPLGEVTFACEVVNVSNTTRNIRIQIWGGSNNRILDAFFTLDPRMTALTGAFSADQPRYCEITVNGKKRSIRASAYLFDPGVGSISVVAAE